MPRKPRAVKRTQAYFPVAVFELLEKRAEKHFNSISNELVQIVAEALQREAQEHPKEAIAQ